jgi:N-carbamoyl-L-amino-acid hydrolase
MTASGAFAGAFTVEHARSIRDADGRTMGEELDRIGYTGDQQVGGRPVHAFFELHIEQGPILEADGVDIGVVTIAQGLRWYEITLAGQDCHAGTTPMDRRRDALLGAARLIEGLNRIGQMTAPDGRTTCGVVRAEPGSRNVIPGRAFLTADVRHPDEATLAHMDRAIRNLAAGTARDLGLEVEIVEITRVPPQPFDPGCRDIIARAAGRLGLSHRDIISGAGHDAVYLARVCPTGMIFVPCVDGISHNEAEDCKPEWVTNGAAVLLHAIVEKADVVAS